MDLVNTIYAPPAGMPIEHDVLSRPGDLVVFAHRVGLGPESAPASTAALRAARRLRDALTAVLRARLDRAGSPALATVERAGRAALRAGRLAERDGALVWTWPDDDPRSPVHRLAWAALELLADAESLARLHRCDACCWLFIDRSRGAGRRWCSMADCGTARKMERYVQRRRERRASGG